MAALLIGGATSALAQSADETTRVDFDATRAVAPAAAAFTPKLRANFRAQQPQLGPSAEDQGISIGVLGMITRTSFNTDDVGENFDLDSKSGWGVGLWVGGNRNGRVGFTGEFIYLKRGDDEGLETTAFQIPAVFHVNFGSRSRNSIGGYVVVGPSFTLIMNQKLFGVDVEDDQFRGADIGIIGGAGVEVFRIGIEARGNWGLRSISSAGDVADTKTFTFELLGKFAFN
ncbi:MAG: PorT family protein [Acidobacteria bacterium]|nr:PorT family protein [Acidobacteriota bacterium]